MITKNIEIDNNEKLLDFLNKVVPSYQNLTMVAGDASFRKYYRLKFQGVSYILMDAPPKHEDGELFAQIAQAFAQAGIRVPEVIEADFEHGFLLLSDFGDVQLLTNLKQGELNLLTDALDQLFKLQKQGGQYILELPEYNHEVLLRELSLFPQWFINELLGTKLDEDQENALSDLNQLLISSAIKQPQVWVHRDYHSRNLMLTPSGNIGVIDFQDAVLGPITYDLASILKDCYIKYDEEQLEILLQRYFIRLVGAEMIYCDYDTFIKFFDFMGLQRHLKVLGIFARLSIRDGKHEYLNDFPLVYHYVETVLSKYSELYPYQTLFAQLRQKMNNKLAKLK